MHGSKDNSNHIILIALAAGKTASEAATAAGVCESTVWKRLRGPRFRKRLQRMRTRMIEGALARLSAGMTEAADRLIELVKDQNPQVSLQACRSVIGLAQNIWRGVDQAQQLEALQDRLEKLLPKEQAGDG